MSRPVWEEYFLGIAHTVATRADCTRRQIGAVIVKDRRIIATGYNGAPAGRLGCLSSGACPRGQKSHDEIPLGSSYDTGPDACIALHAEMNAVLHSSYEDRKGATIYVTGEICDGCLKMLAGSGIVHIVTPENTYVYWTEADHAALAMLLAPKQTPALWTIYEHHRDEQVAVNDG